MKYGEALSLDFVIPTSAFWLRKDLTEGGNPYKLVNIHGGDKVMDCGAYIGTFTVAALEQCAGSAVCYEAAPKNAAMLRAGLARYGTRVRIVEAALTASEDATAKLSLSGFSGANSILPSPNRPKSIQVAAINFRDELLQLRPHVVKIDIEGAEYDLLDSLVAGDLYDVRTIFVEFHPIEQRDERIRRIVRFLTAEGFIIASMRKRANVATREQP